MKIPPSPLLPLHSYSYDDHRPSEPQFASPRKSYLPTPFAARERPLQPDHHDQPHWLTTIMDRQSNQEDENADATPSNSHKGSLAFILGSPPTDAASSAFPQQFLASSSGSDTESDQDVKDSPFPASDKQAKRRRVSLSHPADAVASSSTSSQPPSPERKGSKYCIVDGCTSRAKHARKCWKHGGSVKCKVADCINRAKSKGVCWSHGGGTICSHAQCETIAVSHGFCWAHGGGKRCQVDGCSRPAYERTDNFCSTHYKQHMRAAAAASKKQ